jgi:hypothetical protein
MSPQEVAEWLGVAPLPDGVQVREEIVRGMAEVKVPGTDEEHVAAFSAFLACAGRAPSRVLERRTEEPS